MTPEDIAVLQVEMHAEYVAQEIAAELEETRTRLVRAFAPLDEALCGFGGPATHAPLSLWGHEGFRDA